MTAFGRSPFDEDVNGIVIGEITFPYEFWEEKAHWPFYEPCRIAQGSFENDEQAIAWFKKHYPNEFRAGVEVRVFDR